MPRKPKSAPIACRYFTWRLFLRAGVYYADGRGGKYDLGKHSLATRDRHEALSHLRELDRAKAIELGIANTEDLQPSTAITITDGWATYLQYSNRAGVLGGVSPATLKRYGAVRDKHAKFCAAHGISTWNEFDKASLEQYGNWLSRKYADRTAYFELTLLKSVNHWLIAQNQLPRDHRLEYSLRKPQGTDVYCYSSQEVVAMVAYCEDKPELAWLANVILGLAYTGMRISELAGLRWSDVDLRSGTLRVADERASQRKRRAGTARTTKGRRSRSIPIHPDLRKLLMKLDRTDDGRVFHAPRGGLLRPNNVRTILVRDVIDRLKKQFPTADGDVGFEHGRLHGFRHFFCSQCFLGGASEGEIKEWLGHADSKMVEHYRHLRSEDARRKMDQIEFLRRESREDGSSGVA